MSRVQFRRGDLVTTADGDISIFLKENGDGTSDIFCGNGLRTVESTIALTGMPIRIGSPLGADPYANFAELLLKESEGSVTAAWVQAAMQSDHNCSFCRTTEGLCVYRDGKFYMVALTGDLVRSVVAPPKPRGAGIWIPQEGGSTSEFHLCERTRR